MRGCLNIVTATGFETGFHLAMVASVAPKSSAGPVDSFCARLVCLTIFSSVLRIGFDRLQ